MPKKPNYDAIKHVQKAIACLDGDTYSQARSYLNLAIDCIENRNSKRITRNKFYEDFIEKGLKSREAWLENLKKQQKLAQDIENESKRKANEE